MLGFIMPLTWQTGDNYFRFRDLLFRKLGCSLSSLVNLPFDVFPDAYVDTGIAIFNTNKNNIFFTGLQYDKNQHISSISGSFQKIEFSKVLDEQDLKVFPSNFTYDFLRKMQTNAEPLGKITKSCQGIVTSKFQLVGKKESAEYYPFMLNAEGNRYVLLVHKRAFIKLASTQNILTYYVQPKILIRRIINRQDRLMAMYEQTGLITNKDYNPFVILSKDFEIFYLLALLNSKLFSFIYVNKSPLALKDDFRQTTLAELRKLPIKYADTQRQWELGTIAIELSRLTSEYYDLINKFVRRIEGNFKILSSTKIRSYYKLNYEVFRREIEVKIKRILSLREQDEWETYFEESKNLAVTKRQEIQMRESQAG